MANREIGKHLDGQTASGPRSPTSTLVGTRNGHGEAGERSHRQSLVARASHLEPRTVSRPGLTTAVLARADERQRLARDLHDGVQTELLSLMLRLKLAERIATRRPRSPPPSSRSRTTPRPRSHRCEKSPTTSTRFRSPSLASRKRCAR